jgi:hypothetical protein
LNDDPRQIQSTNIMIYDTKKLLNSFIFSSLTPHT